MHCSLTLKTQTALFPWRLITHSNMIKHSSTLIPGRKITAKLRANKSPSIKYKFRNMYRGTKSQKHIPLLPPICGTRPSKVRHALRDEPNLNFRLLWRRSGRNRNDDHPPTLGSHHHLPSLWYITIDHNSWVAKFIKLSNGYVFVCAGRRLAPVNNSQVPPPPYTSHYRFRSAYLSNFEWISPQKAFN